VAHPEQLLDGRENGAGLYRPQVEAINRRLAVLLLENLRFHPEREKRSCFAKQLASLWIFM